MGSRKQEIQAVLKSAERNGCTVEDPGEGKRYKVKCSCEEKHLKYISKTPSGQFTPKRMLIELRRWGCWQQNRE